LDSAGESFGVVGVFAAFLFRERVPEVGDGFVNIVVGDFTRSKRSARAGLLVEFNEQCNVGAVLSATRNTPGGPTNNSRPRR
jgi:hypothetical protein